MRIQYDICSNFKNYEYVTEPKVLINICDADEYDVTDSNEFYNRFYAKTKDDFNNPAYKHKLGSNAYINIYSYHIICNMFCVVWPKTQLNIKPFKYPFFKACCRNLKDYMLKNNIKNIISPPFGLEILEGKWKDIFIIMNGIFPNDFVYTIIKSN